MAVTTAPSEEACQAIVDRINTGSGITYTLAASATYGYKFEQARNDITALQVFVLHETERTLDETLDVENRTSHEIRIFVRQKLTDATNTLVNAVLLTARKIFQRVNNFNSANGRVRVWECDLEPADPEIDPLIQLDVCQRTILLRVEVEASP